MQWRKQGVLVPPPVDLPWAASHAAVPHVDVVSDDELRIYFTTRDHQRRSVIARADVHGDLVPANVRLHDGPLLTSGEPGLFDDSGVMTSCLVRHGGRQYLYYQGWSLAVTVPYIVVAGLAVSDDDGATFARVSRAPVVDRSAVDPYWVSSPWVLVDEGRWRMWYVAGLGWHFDDEGRADHYIVHIRYAESDDGIAWRRDGRVCVDFAAPGEYAIARPVVLRDGDRYRMWYAYRGESYRIGYAESDDGLEWRRLDDRAGIDVSPGSWDATMVEYGCVFDYHGQRHMLYNGDGFGASGIGHAIAEDGP